MREYAAAPRPISPVVHRLTRAGLEPLRLDPDHAAFVESEAARVRFWAEEVAVQAARFEQPVQPIGVKRPDGRTLTAVRVLGAATALPEAEHYVNAEAPTGQAMPATWPRWRRV